MSADQNSISDAGERILLWLPSPMGDAILATAALRAIRKRHDCDSIFLIGGPVVRDILSPTSFADEWCPDKVKSPFAVARILRQYDFTQAILFANSFSSALAVFLAGIPVRIGYARGGRGLLLTDRLCPPRIKETSSTASPAARSTDAVRGLSSAMVNRFAAASMVDYYLALASWTGADTDDTSLELQVDPAAQQQLADRMPALADSARPLVILVPGGAFGPSKCWPAERFAETADRLIDNHGAQVVISVDSSEMETGIARRICQAAENKLINLADSPLTLGQLKALFAGAALVITNDTGPRHIAIALKRRLITLFGPNDPAWTETGYENEIKIAGDAPCAPCAKPHCPKDEHLCMEAITVETVCEAAAKHLSRRMDRPTDV